MLRAVRERFVASPRTPDAFSSAADTAPFPTFVETEGYLYLPPYTQGIDFAPPPPPATPADAAFAPGTRDCSIQLRVNQEPLVEDVLRELRDHRGCLLSVGCGYGKTVMSVWVMSRLRLRTLVIVHKTFLMDQFRETLRKYMPSAAVGEIRGGVVDVDGKDVVLGMLQTLSSDKFRPSLELRKAFGFVVVDECHHVAARVFSRAMMKFPSRHTLGLSATPDRKDGLGWLVHEFVGRRTVTASDAGSRRAIRLCVRVSSFHHPAECGCGGYGRTRTRFVNRKQVTMLPLMVTDVVGCRARTERVVRIVLDPTMAGRNVLVVSDRRDHLQQMLEMVVAEGRSDVKAGLYVGGMKAADRDAVARECNVIFGSYAMTREGLDIDRLDTLVMATSTSDVVQVVGRVMRKPGSSPLVIDVVDGYSVFLSHYRKRLRTYRTMEAVVTYDASGAPADEEEEEEEEKAGAIKKSLFSRERAAE